MVFNSRFRISVSGALKVSVDSNVLFLAIYADLNPPSFVSFVPIHALLTACVGFWAFTVVLVLANACASKIFNSVVRRIAVDVVNNLWRKLAVMPQPDNPVRQIILAV